MNNVIPPLTQERVMDWLVEFLAEILDIAPREIDPTTPLDHLGVDSATTLVICARLREDLGVQARPKDVLEHFTTDALARHLTGALPAGV
ncbi:acyl carrier protein [Streptomyces sp. ISL-11]|uniref:acyl carrier protein n=1 Tax=Streptomyces sp. ISL-11 TaxID=2819174 RepID=UPI001BE5A50C|nr:acyl carrier protein [Streptomyces sp. ISL-11]MBT2385829.1 acyl carrier protein [Streptomyces sp. ISL-11]